MSPLASVDNSASDVFTLGETLGVISVDRPGPLQLGAQCEIDVAGAEFNTAVGLARLGHRVQFASAVGADEFGELVAAAARAEGIETHIAIDSARPTGLLYRFVRIADVTKVRYYRAGSAATSFTLSDSLRATVRGARLVHLTGITPALSPSLLGTIHNIVEIARESEIVISFDINFRSRLWPAAKASTVLRPIAEQADMLFGSEAEFAMLLGSSVFDASMLETLASRRAIDCVVKLGSRGARGFAVGPAGVEEDLYEPAVSVPVTDVVGAGDAFVAGYLSAYLDGRDRRSRLRRGVEAGAFAVAARGDWRGAPHRHDLPLIRAIGDENVVR